MCSLHAVAKPCCRIQRCAAPATCLCGTARPALDLRVMLTQDPPSWHPASEEVKAAAIKSKELCAAKGTDLARIAIKQFPVTFET